MPDNRIKPADFTPPEKKSGGRKLYLSPLTALSAVLLILLIYGLWYVFTATSIDIKFNPPADSVRIEGGLSLELGGRRMIRPGEYQVVAHKKGYHPFKSGITVRSGDNEPFVFELEKLPGRLDIMTTPEGAAVTIDDEEIGKTPVQSHSLEPGKHEVVLRARRYEVHETTVDIEGKDILQTLEVELTPAWAEITYSSEPSGATLLVDGQATGQTPLTAEIGAGDHEVALRLEGYQTWTDVLTVIADQPRTIPTVKLKKALGRIQISSKPEQASVSVGNAFRGRTPLTISIQPDTATTVRISKPGHTPARRTVRVASNQQKSLSVELEPIRGEVEFIATPKDAQLYIDGQHAGNANRKFRMLAVEHDIEIRKDGYATYKTTVLPKPGFTQQVNAELLTEEEARLARFPQIITTATGQKLKRIKVGERFTMGAPRREQGRQANEYQRDVILTRHYYLGMREVTNKAFRQFRSSHSSGIVERKTLDNDNYPVVRISWQEAIEFCNWLSRKDGLPEAYSGGKLREPVNTGYRLPTEAEWAWAARFAGGPKLKYPWGQNMPPRDKAGNFADISSAGIIRKHLETYNDGFPVVAPVGSFPPNRIGLYDLGGNVREWVNDHYGGLSNLTSTEKDPLGIKSGKTHVIRDSSWRHGRITELRLSYRSAGAEGADDVGFRLARYME